MKKERKMRMIFIIVPAIFVLLLAAGLSVFLKMRSEQFKMTPIDTDEVLSGIFAVRTDFVNFFLIKSDSGYIAVDAGMGPGAVERELAKLNISADEIQAVLLTHLHGDHTGALGLFKNAKIYVGENNSSNHNFISKKLQDGETMQLDGVSVQCIATPGHTDGSVCYLVDEKYLFAGDNLSLNDNQVALFNSFYNKSDAIQTESIQKLSKLEGVEHILTAHYGHSDRAVFP